MVSTGVPGIVTQTTPSPAAIQPPSPGTPAWIVATTVFVAGSMCDTLPSLWLSTQTPPSPAARNRGVECTMIVAVTVPPAGSTRSTVSEAAVVTQTAPKPYAAAVEPNGTCTRLVI